MQYTPYDSLHSCCCLYDRNKGISDCICKVKKGGFSKVGEVQIKPFKRVLVANRAKSPSVFIVLWMSWVLQPSVFIPRKTAMPSSVPKQTNPISWKKIKVLLMLIWTSRALLKLPRRQMLMLSIQAMVFSLRIRTLLRPAQKPHRIYRTFRRHHECHGW